MTDETEARGLAHAQDSIDVYSCSYGARDDGQFVGGPDELARQAVKMGATTVSQTMFLCNFLHIYPSKVSKALKSVGV